MGVDPLGGAGVHYWARIAERYGLDLTVVNDEVDRDLPLHDRRLGRPDPHGPVVALRDAAPASASRTASTSPSPATPTTTGTASSRRQRGLLPPNHYLAVAIDYLFRAPAAVARRTRPSARPSSAAADRSRRRSGSGASSTKCRSASSGSSTACSTARSASAAKKAPAPRSCAATARSWTTDKDGIVAGAARRPRSRRSTGRDPGELYASSTQRARRARSTDRVEAPATRRRRSSSPRSRPSSSARRELAGEKIESVLDQGAGQRRRDRRHQGHRRRAAGSRRGRRAPRTSTRSTPRASAAPSTCSAS